eukprot:172651-Prorocentrum_minimum.AAC.1
MRSCCRRCRRRWREPRGKCSVISANWGGRVHTPMNSTTFCPRPTPTNAPKQTPKIRHRQPLPTHTCSEPFRRRPPPRGAAAKRQRLHRARDEALALVSSFSVLIALGVE